ncbi:hypothetical protein ACL2XO_22530 [Sodalis sp. RH15]|uniref:hypothetical protein n=1 Tax=Sodalis sp. RH15 TaxID=3394330 RepID=UPI0039B5E806
MNNAIVNEAFVKTVAQDKTIPALLTSLGKYFTRGYNAALSPRNEHSQSTAAVQPPLKNAEEMAALAQSIKAQMTACAKSLCGGLSTLEPLIRYLEDDSREISYDNIEYLINERIEGAKKHNFLRALITDLYLCSTSENGDEYNKTLALNTLQKELCGHPFKSFGDLNPQRHGNVFSTAEGREAFRTQILKILKDLKDDWHYTAAKAEQHN